MVAGDLGVFKARVGREKWRSSLLAPSERMNGILSDGKDS
jgi:hypothetical protein